MAGKTLAEEWAEDMGIPAASIGPRKESPIGDSLPTVDVSGNPVRPYAEASAEYGNPEVAPRSGLGLTRRQRGLLETGAEMGASMTGAMYGPRAAEYLAGKGLRFFGGPAGRIIAGITGSGLGEAGIQQFMVQDDESRLAETSKAFARGALAEAFGQGLRFSAEPVTSRAISLLKTRPRLGKAVDPFSGKLALGAEDAIEQLRPYEVSPSAGQLSTSGLVDNVENVAEASLLGGPIIRGWRAKAEGRAVQMLRNFADRFGRTRTTEEVGELMGSILRGEKEAHQAFVQAEVKNLDKLGRHEVTVDISDVLANAQAGLKAAERLGDEGRGLRRVYNYVLRPEKQSVVPGIGAPRGARARTVERYLRPKRVSFEEAQEIRSILLEIGRSSDDPLPPRAIAIANKFAGDVHGKMDLSAKLSGNSELYNAWVDFNDLVSGGHIKFGNQVMRQLMGHTEPSKIYENGIKGMVPPERIRNIRGIIEKGVAEGRVDPVVWEDIQGRWLRDTLAQAESVETGQLEGKALLEQIKKAGPERMKALFPEDGGSGFRKFARTLYLTQKSVASGEGGGNFGGVAMRLLQAGAVLTYPVALWKGSGEERAAATANLAFVLLGPAALARVLRDPKAISLITQGMRTGPTTSSARIFSQLQVHLRDILPPGSAYEGEIGNSEGKTSNPASTGGVPGISDLATKGVQ